MALFSVKRTWKKIAINVNLIHETRDSCECHSVIVEVLSQFGGLAFQALRLKPYLCFRLKTSDARTQSSASVKNLDHAHTQRLCARCRAHQKNPDYPTDGREPRRERALWLVVSATSLFSWQHSGGSFREQKPCQYAVKNDISVFFLMCVNKWSYSDWISKYKRCISYRVHSRHNACSLTTVLKLSFSTKCKHISADSNYSMLVFSASKNRLGISNNNTSALLLQFV